MAEAARYPRLSTFKKVEDFRAHVAGLGIELPCDDEIATAPDSPLAQAAQVGDFTIGNRFAIHPMEGWDGTTDGLPSDYTRRRWRNFGLSGAKLIWGGGTCPLLGRGRPHPLTQID